MQRSLAILLALLALAAGALDAQAQRRRQQSMRAPAPASTDVPKEKKAHAPPPAETESVTQHRVTIQGQEIRYTAKAGTINMKNQEGKAIASMFYIAYTKDGEDDPGKRPLTFSFNGGPGSSSVWLHLGVFGPRRTVMDDNGFPTPPPYRLVDNEYSLLDISDFVFIDPVSTGYSRPAPGEDKRQFHGVREDVESVGDFIHQWTARNGRWASPIFVAGESYGTTRAAGLSAYLQDRHGLYPNGLILVSAVLEFITNDFHPGNDLPAITHLPTYTAIAWHHGQLPADLQADLDKALDESRAFALGEYALALHKGNALSDEERDRTAAQLSRLTGLSPGYIKRANLRVHIARFVKELLRGQGLTVGRLDGRFKGRDADSAGERYEYDPSMAAIRGPYTATLNDYLRRELQYESDAVYEILSRRVRPWNYGEFSNQYVNVAEYLRQAMNKNRHLKVFVANGYYDLATPFFATEYTFNHLAIDPELSNNIDMAYYKSGHMMYIHIPSLAKMRKDLETFYQSALNQ